MGHGSEAPLQMPPRVARHDLRGGDPWRGCAETKDGAGIRHAGFMRLVPFVVFMRRCRDRGSHRGNHAVTGRIGRLCALPMLRHAAQGDQNDKQ